MKEDGELFRLTAFPAAPGGGNPAGVWLGRAFPGEMRMQAIAADVGYSETAFLVPRGPAHYRVRYFSPEAEVPFCGHATIAAGVVLGRAEGAGRRELATVAGPVTVDVSETDGTFTASLTSVTPRHEDVPDQRLEAYLAALAWDRNRLDPAIPPIRAFAGAWHLVLGLKDRDTLAALAYDFDSLKSLMLDDDLTTVQAVYRESDGLWHSRNPFPVGGVVEDPATGAAAAALGGYLRDAELIDAPAEIKILQGHDMGRPSRLDVSVPATGGIVVTGSAAFL